MAGVGEASALATFITLGFSLVKALDSYIGDVQEANDEVSALATEIDATLRQVQELEALLETNQITKGWNNNGVVLAEKCRDDSVKVVNKLVGLLKKSNAALPENGTIGRQDVNLSLFSRLQWPRFKPKLDVAKREVERTRIDILFVKSLYNAKLGASLAERQDAKEDIVALVKKKGLLRKQVRLAKRREQRLSRTASPHVVFRDYDHDHDRNRDRGYDQDQDHVRQRRGIRRSRREDDYSSIAVEASSATSSSDEGSESLVFLDTDLDELNKQIRNRIEQGVEDGRLAEKQQIKAEADATKQRLTVENDAVEKYKEQLKDKLKYLKEHASQVDTRLKKTFDAALPPEQIQQYVESEQQLHMDADVSEFISYFHGKVAAAGANCDSLDGSVPLKGRASGLLSRLRPRAGTTGHGRPSGNEILPASLQQHHFIPGCARVMGISLSPHNEEWSTNQVHVDMHWLISTLNALEKSVSRRRPKINKTLQDYSRLPAECKAAADGWLEAVGRRKVGWTLLYAQVTRTKVSKVRRLASRALLGSEVGEYIESVLLVYKSSRDLPWLAEERSAATIPEVCGISPEPALGQEVIAANNVDAVDSQPAVAPSRRLLADQASKPRQETALDPIASIPPMPRGNYNHGTNDAVSDYPGAWQPSSVRGHTQTSTSMVPTVPAPYYPVVAAPKPPGRPSNFAPDELTTGRSARRTADRGSRWDDGQDYSSRRPDDGYNRSSTVDPYRRPPYRDQARDGYSEYQSLQPRHDRALYEDPYADEDVLHDAYETGRRMSKNYGKRYVEARRQRHNTVPRRKPSRDYDASGINDWHDGWSDHSDDHWSIGDTFVDDVDSMLGSRPVRRPSAKPYLARPIQARSASSAGERPPRGLLHTRVDAADTPHVRPNWVLYKEDRAIGKDLGLSPVNLTDSDGGSNISLDAMTIPDDEKLRTRMLVKYTGAPHFETEQERNPGESGPNVTEIGDDGQSAGARSGAAEAVGLTAASLENEPHPVTPLPRPPQGAPPPAKLNGVHEASSNED